MAEKKPKRPPRKRAPQTNQSSTVHELEITLLDVEPRIWRRFVVRSDMTLAKLHSVVQVVMGWTDSHMHQFITPDETRYSLPSPFDDPDWNEQISDARKARVADVLPAKGAQIVYEYDFGDGWAHVIEVADIRASESPEKVPRCMAGERNCPPEDCGGPYGYPELLAALANPKHPEHENLVEWTGGEFDAEMFALDEINGILAGSR